MIFFYSLSDQSNTSEDDELLQVSDGPDGLLGSLSGRWSESSSVNQEEETLVNWARTPDPGTIRTNHPSELKTVMSSAQAGPVASQSQLLNPKSAIDVAPVGEGRQDSHHPPGHLDDISLAVIYETIMAHREETCSESLTTQGACRKIHSVWELRPAQNSLIG